MTIGKTDCDFDSLRFIGSALDKKVPWYYMIYVSDGMGIGTDGKRQHAAPISGIEDGTYDIVQNTTSAITLEKSTKEFPKSYTKFMMPINSEYITIDMTEDIATAYATIYRSIPEQYTINPDFLKPLLGDIWKMTISETAHHVHFDGEASLSIAAIAYSNIE